MFEVLIFVEFGLLRRGVIPLDFSRLKSVLTRSTDDYSDSFIEAFDEGGMVWEGRKAYKTLDEALQALEKGLAGVDDTT